MSALQTETPEELAALADGKGVLCIMDGSGDARQIWDPSRPDEVAVAKAAFDAAIARGMVAYSVKEDGTQGARIRTFPQDAGKVILAPKLVGG